MCTFFINANSLLRLHKCIEGGNIVQEIVSVCRKATREIPEPTFHHIIQTRVSSSWFLLVIKTTIYCLIPSIFLFIHNQKSSIEVVCFFFLEFKTVQ